MGEKQEAPPGLIKGTDRVGDSQLARMTPDYVPVEINSLSWGLGQPGVAVKYIAM